ncbi:MAG TPA: SDR family oxidoreductase [Armatimonadota bacterium]|nr:SDR family oxidoreductase [Armatimonadota bacterium]
MTTIRLKPIHEQVVVLMGASSGIGRATALLMARRGARVVVSARGESKLASLVREIEDAGGSALAVPAEVTDVAQVKHVADRAVEEYGRLDTWVQLAGIGEWATFEQTTPEEWKRIIDVNLNGQAYGAMAALPHLRRGGGGALIHISSVEALMAVPYQTAYAASKHGIHGFVKALRLELREDGAPISVTEIMPAGTDTPIFDQARTKIGVKPQPLPPFYHPDVVAEAILHAAQHPTREIILSGVCKAGIVLQGVAPRLMDAYLQVTSFRQQRTDVPKDESAPDNLFAPREEAGSVKGTLTPNPRTVSRWAWLDMHPTVKASAGVALVGLAALLVGRAVAKCQAAPPADE